MKNFQEFLQEIKIKRLAKKIEKQVSKSIKKQEKKNPGQPVVAHYGDSQPGSPERKAAIRAMMNIDKSGRDAMKKAQKKRENDNLNNSL